MNKIRILVVDDHPMMREALTMALSEEDDMEVIGDATNGDEAIKLAVEFKPDVIMMDLLMSGLDGVEAIARICEINPQTKILVVSSLEDEDQILASIQAGALGYFPKTTPRKFLLEAIRKIADGIPYMPGGITLKLFKSLRDMKDEHSSVPDKNTNEKPLTTRQEQILALLTEGYSVHAIAKLLHLEAATVRSHLHHIMQRLGVEKRVQLMDYTNRIQKD